MRRWNPQAKTNEKAKGIPKGKNLMVMENEGYFSIEENT